MISEKELVRIGSIVKPHGINGEVAATINVDIDVDALKCIVLDIDGIFVPFFIKSSRPRGSEAVLLTIDGINDEIEASRICGLDIFALNDDLGITMNDEGDEGFYVSDLIGFTLSDEGGNKIGIIKGYDDSTANVLLHVEDNTGAIKLIPMADELIEDFDAVNKNIALNIPFGLLDL